MTCNNTPSGVIPYSDKFSYIEAKRGDFQYICAEVLQGSTVSALIDVCIGGPTDTLNTVEGAFAAGYKRIRIRGNVSETAAVITLPDYVHIWIDGGVTWTLPLDTTLDATASTVVWISGNSSGRLVFSRSTPGQLITAPAGAHITYVFENLLIDFSATTASNVQMCSKSALQRYRNVDVTMPNVADIRFFDFESDFFDPLDPEISSSVENAVLRGTGTAISHMIGHAPGLATSAGYYRNITLTGTLPVGNGTFAQPVIEFFGAIGGGAITFDTLQCDVQNQVLDIIMSGNCSRILRRNLGGSPQFNMRVVGNSSQTIADCTVNVFDVRTTSSQFESITCGNMTIDVAASNNTFVNIINQFTVSVGLQCVGSNNRFTACRFVVPQAAGMLISGNQNIFTGCDFYDIDVVNPAPAAFMTISGSGNTLIGCLRIGIAPAERNLVISGPLTTVVGCNLTDISGTTGKTISFTGAPTTDVQVSNNIVDNAIFGAVTGVVAGNHIA